MENAAKALLMAGEVLIGILLLFLLVYFSNMAHDYTTQIDRNIELKQLEEFNVKFEAYNNRSNLTPQDVVTLSNVVKQCNESQNRYTEIKISIAGVESTYRGRIQHGFTQEEGASFMIRYAPTKDADGSVKTTTFSCIMGYDVKSGSINKIDISLNK